MALEAGREVHITAVHVVCHACGSRQLLVELPADYEPLCDRGGTWMVSHRDPHLVAVDVLADGKPATWAVARANPTTEENPCP